MKFAKMALVMVLVCASGLSQARIIKTFFPGRASKEFVKNVKATSYPVRKELGEPGREDIALTFNGAHEDRSYYLGKIRMEFIPSITWKVPGDVLKLGVAVFPVFHVTRNPPKGFKKVK